MTEHFNLLDEPWILVRDKNGGTAQVSLTDALLRAQDYTALAGESPAQDAAILRLLIAVVYTVFYRTDEDGQLALLEDEEEALNRWSAIWQKGAFPVEPLTGYLEKWHSRFDLLDQERPFYQVPEVNVGTRYSAAKLNGDILQSENKKRIFAGRTEEHSQTLSFPEAARWLVYLQGYDDASIKPIIEERKEANKRIPKGVPRIGWLGNLGLLYAAGENLFETVWLNTVFLRDGQFLYGEEPQPVWEQEEVCIKAYHVLPALDDLAALFTKQGRRVILEQEDGQIKHYKEYCGDLLNAQNAFAEPMTVWGTNEKAENPEYTPQTHETARQLWRDFSSFAIQTGKTHLPGISSWLKRLQEEGCLEQGFLLRYASVAVQYDKKKNSVVNTFSDTLEFHADLLTEAGHEWQQNIENEIRICDELAMAVGVLAGELALAAGKREIENKKPRPPARMEPAKAAKSQFYFRVDAAFRDWLSRPQAGQDDFERKELCDEWRSTAEQIVRRQGKELVDEAGQTAFLGHSVDDKHYSSAEAYNRFSWKIGKILGKETRKESEHGGNS